MSSLSSISSYNSTPYNSYSANESAKTSTTFDNIFKEGFAYKPVIIKTEKGLAQIRFIGKNIKGNETYEIGVYVGNKFQIFHFYRKEDGKIFQRISAEKYIEYPDFSDFISDFLLNYDLIKERIPKDLLLKNELSLSDNSDHISINIDALTMAQPKPQPKKVESTNAFFQYTILQALNNNELQQLKNENSNLSLWEKIKFGCKVGIVSMPGRLSVIICASSIISAISTKICFQHKPSSEDLPTFFEGIFAAVLEEIVFRGIYQNLIYYGQKNWLEVFPNWKNNRIFKWLTSPSARILMTNTLFAAMHLENAGGYLSTSLAIGQVTNIFLYPTNSIVYEITGSLIASIASHSTNNAIAHLMVLLTKI